MHVLLYTAHACEVIELHVDQIFSCYPVVIIKHMQAGSRLLANIQKLKIEYYYTFKLIIIHLD